MLLALLSSLNNSTLPKLDIVTLELQIAMQK
jgi:hypothetical protein